MAEWHRHRVGCVLRTWYSTLLTTLWEVEPFGYPCQCGCYAAPVEKSVKDILYDNYNAWVRKWYDRSCAVRVVRDMWYTVLVAIDETIGTMLGEEGHGACGHLHRFADGYCPSCNRFLK